MSLQLWRYYYNICISINAKTHKSGNEVGFSNFWISRILFSMKISISHIAKPMEVANSQRNEIWNSNAIVWFLIPRKSIFRKSILAKYEESYRPISFLFSQIKIDGLQEVVWLYLIWKITLPFNSILFTRWRFYNSNYLKKVGWKKPWY